MTDETRTALLQAIDTNEAKKFRKILKRQGWPCDSKWSDYELLVEALRRGRKRIAQVMLDRNVRVYKWPARWPRQSPLHIAASKATTTRWTKLIAGLLSRGARVTDKNLCGDTALHVAFQCDAQVEAIDLMLQAHLSRCKRIDGANEDGLRFLHIACARSRLQADKVARFVDETNVNSQVSLKCDKNYAGYTPLHFAVDNLRHEVAELLIRHGANVDKGDCNGTTPLHLALRRRDVRMIDLLLAHEEEKRNFIDNTGLSHFMAACAGSQPSVVEAYLAEFQSRVPLYDMISAQVEKVENCTGYTPLHFAVDLGQAETVEFLLDEGADCCVTTADGVTPHMLAEKRGHLEVCKMLREHCKIAITCLMMRSQDADFGAWGDDYERCVVNERVREIKQLQKTLRAFKSMTGDYEPTMVTVTVDKCN